MACELLSNRATSGIDFFDSDTTKIDDNVQNLIDENNEYPWCTSETNRLAKVVHFDLEAGALKTIKLRWVSR
jgi:hypothetical protein